MAAAMTPSQLLEIRRVRAMASSAPNTPENNCFRGEKGDKGDKGDSGDAGLPGTPLGNVILVDLVNPPTNTTSFSSISDAIAAINNGFLTNQTIWLLPGIHILQNGISIPNGCSIRGISAQTVFIRMENVTGNTTMISMGDNTSIEDCTIQLITSEPYDIAAIRFFRSTTFTSKVKGCNIYLNNFTIIDTPTDVIGVLADDIGVENTDSELIEAAESGSLACVENSTIQIISNYGGRKRGIYVLGGANDFTNIVTIKNTSIFVKNPSVVDASGSLSGNFSWCAVENNSEYSKIICFTSILSGPTTASHLDNSDISQTLGEIIIGEGTTLVNKRPRLKPSSSLLCYPFKALTDKTTLFYAAIGKIKNHDPDKDGFLLPGTMMIQNYVPSGTYPNWINTTAPVFDFKYPIPSPSQPQTPSIKVQGAYYSITKRSILMSAKVRLGRRQTTGSTGNVFSISVKVYYDRPYNSVTGPQQLFSITLNNNQINKTYDSNSGVFLLEEGGELRVSMNYTGGVGTDNFTGNLGEDLYVELELY